MKKCKLCAILTPKLFVKREKYECFLEAYHEVICKDILAENPLFLSIILIICYDIISET